MVKYVPINQKLAASAGIDHSLSFKDGVLKQAHIPFLVADDFGITYSAVTDNTTKLQTAITAMNTQKKKLYITGPVVASAISISGFCDVETIGEGVIYLTGTGSFSCINTWSLVTTYSAVSEVRYPVGTGAYCASITVADASGIAAGDVLYIKDSDTTQIQTPATPPVAVSVAEIFRVTAVSGTTVYLDGKFRMTYASGSVYKLPETVMKLKGRFVGDLTNIKPMIYLEGYVGMDIDVSVRSNAHNGVKAMSCAWGRARVEAWDLVDGEDLTPQKLGYAWISYGACKEIDVDVRGGRCRHMITDGVWGNTGIMAGSNVNMKFSGIAHGCSSASFDTHPYSYGATFDVEAYAGHSNDVRASLDQLEAVQVRGVDVTIKSLITDLNVGINYNVTAFANSTLNIGRVRHLDLIHGVLAGSNVNEIVSLIVFSKSGSGTHTIRAVNSDLAYIKNSAGGMIFDFIGCRLNFSRTTSNWPASGSTTNVWTFKGCVIDTSKTLAIANGNDDWRLYDTLIRTSAGSAANRSFNLANGAVLTAINCTLQAASGTVYVNGSSHAAFAYTTIGTGAVSFTYSHLNIIDTTAAANLVSFSDDSTGGTVTTKNVGL